MIVDWIFIALIFAWTGFVRTSLGFGGAALGLPLMLLVGKSPIFWLPIIGIHLLFFSSLTLKGKLDKIDWVYLRYSLLWILPPALIGVFGLISLPNDLLSVIIYSITLFYGSMWAFGSKIDSRSAYIDKILLIIGGYVAGLSLTGAPMMVAVYLKNVTKEYLRNTLFALWIILVSIKMATFITFGVDIHWEIALALLPVAYIGHYLGLKAHNIILYNQNTFKRFIGIGLVIVSVLGLVKEGLSN